MRSLQQKAWFGDGVSSFAEWLDANPEIGIKDNHTGDWICADELKAEFYEHKAFEAKAKEALHEAEWEARLATGE